MNKAPQTYKLVASVVLGAGNVTGTAEDMLGKRLHQLSSDILLSMSTVCGSSIVSRAILKSGAVFLTYGKSRLRHMTCVLRIFTAHINVP